jgi:hypothetical protein
VALFLKAHEVKTERLAVSGYSATRPLTSNATPEGRRKNRRVLIKIKANEKQFATNDSPKDSGRISASNGNN